LRSKEPHIAKITGVSYNITMINVHAAEATYKDWHLPYVLGARILVKRIAVKDGPQGRAQRRYVAYRCKKQAGRWVRVTLGYCDPLGYPLTQLALM